MEQSPKLSPEELVEKMKSKNIRFELMSEADAIEYLRVNNNYFRTASYRKNYDKHFCGKNKGKYIDLDFACLTELSTIDMHLRFIILKMCLDLEHSLKVNFLSDITLNNNEDGYSIVKTFLDNNKYILTDIYYKRNSVYVGDLISKFFTFKVDRDAEEDFFNNVEINCPIWAFMEIISFGDFARLYSSYYELYPNDYNYTAIINPIKSIRNACAHNNCLIHDLRRNKYTRPSAIISRFIGEITSITKSEKQSTLKVRTVFEITSLLYLYDKIVPNPVKKHRLDELSTIVYERMQKHSDYFKKQDIIKSSYIFIKKVLDFLIESSYNTNDIKKQ